MMFKHIVMWKFKDAAEGKTKAENISRVKEGLYALPAIIPELKSLRLVEDVTQSPRSFDMILFTEFDSPEAMKVYLVHPEHKKVSSYVALVTEGRGSVDYYE